MTPPPRLNGLILLQQAQRARDAALTLLAAPGFADFGRGSRIMFPFRAGNPHMVSVGRDVLIGPSSWFMVPLLDADGPVIYIGDRVRMNQTSISAVEEVRLGRSVGIGRGVYISDHSHGFADPSTDIGPGDVLVHGDEFVPLRLEVSLHLLGEGGQVGGLLDRVAVHGLNQGTATDLIAALVAAVGVGDEDAAGLEVAGDQAGGVGRVHALGHLPHQLEFLLQGQPA